MSVRDSGVRVAVFGSWRDHDAQTLNEHGQGADSHWLHRLTKESFRQACRDLGKALAESGATVILASDSTSTTDYQVAQGALAAQTVGSCIELVRSSAPRSSRLSGDCLGIYAEEIRTNPGHFGDVHTLHAVTAWEDVHDFMLEQADRIVIIGGGNSSYRAAVRGLTSETLIVPIGVFGGAGREVIDLLRNIGDTRNFPKHQYRETLNASDWQQEQLDASLYALGVEADPRLRRKIFINYRRSDTLFHAGVIQSRLSAEFLPDDIFRDVESIPASERFEEAIRSSLDQSLLVLVLIGPDWLTANDQESGRRRLDNPEDFVRREIELALKDSVPILPVCVDGAQVPVAASLPVSIQGLVDHNAIFISGDSLNEDMNHLVESVRRAVDAGM